MWMVVIFIIVVSPQGGGALNISK